MAKAGFFGQISNFLSKLSIAQKIILFGVTFAVLFGLIYLIVQTSSKIEYATLFTQLDPTEAGKIVEKLKEKKIPYKLEDNGTTILVDKTKVYDTRISIAAEGLPESGIVGYEIFDKTNLGMSEFVQKLNYRRALEGELSKTIASLNGVKKARVHIVIPEKALFEKDQKQPTASVTLQLAGENSLSRLNIRGIQNLVASSVEGLTPNNVTVVDHKGRIISESELDPNSVLGKTQSQHEQQIRVEQYLTNKVQSLLDGVLGPGNSEVRVSAELDFTQIEKTITDYNPDRQVVRSEQSITQSARTVDSLQYPAPNRTVDQANTITNYEIPQTIERIVNGVGTIKRITVGALINGTYKVTEKDGKKQIEYIPRSEEELKKLEDIVKNAVGFDPNRNDQISIVNIPFDTQTPEPEILEPPTPWYLQPEYLRLWGLLAAILITILLIAILFHSKQVKETTRIAMALPEPRKLIEEEKEDIERELEGLRTTDEQLLFLPTEMPEQLLLTEETRGITIPEETVDLSIIKKPSVKLAESPAFTEDALMKREIRERIKEYIDTNPTDAVKLVRMYLVQEEPVRRELYK
ncbi:MAG: flagellar basal-body MS-ring/collar protein FliF [Ignavibacteria bacterium]|nr:flagellar basal-body MS-ring/collar protein FliF [Ignavibacteria bacterium]